jgi:hypothetical protein
MWYVSPRPPSCSRNQSRCCAKESGSGAERSAGSMGAVTELRWSLAARASFSSLSALVTDGVNVMGRKRWLR